MLFIIVFVCLVWNILWLLYIIISSMFIVDNVLLYSDNC